MKDWKKTLIPPDTTILEAMKIIDEGALQIALVISNNNNLLGTITDGDIRRGIIKGIKLSDNVEKIMNPHPIICEKDKSREEIVALMKIELIHQIPIVDERGCVVGLEVLDEVTHLEEQENLVILMAGGFGSRLRPLTDDCPKPLLRVGSKPLLEIILKSFIEFGFKRFYFSVLYKGDMIEEYFKDGSKWGVQIRYIHEDKAMGTAGALGLLPERPDKPIIVMNADLLTKVNFRYMLRFHYEHKASATMCVREYDVQIPYGVARLEKSRLIGIDEKPSQHFFVNAGIYVLEPEILDMVPKNSQFDMPSLFEKLIEKNLEIAVFPIREYWLDIGHADDFERANWDYDNNFDLVL